MNTKFVRTSLTTLVFLGCGLSQGDAFAAGFEKATMWSGKWAPLGGAASAGVSGAESVFFNPAGLGGISGNDVSINLSPTEAFFSGPVATTTNEHSTPEIAPVLGAFYSKGLNQNLGFGLGVYVSGGASSLFENLDYTQVQMGLNEDESGLVDISEYSRRFTELQPTIGTSLKLIELSPAVGYRISDSLSVGFGWRALVVTGELKSAKVKEAGAAGAVLVNATLGDLTAMQLVGWRAGLQFTPSKSFGLGLSVRGPMSFTLKGQTSGKVDVGETGWPELYEFTGGDVSASTTLPLQASLGMYIKLGDRMTLFPEYTFTQYSINQTIALDGSITMPDELLGEEVALSDLKLEWSDQHNVRFGLQYDWSDTVALKAGYVYTTQVTPASRAKASSSAPGPGHTALVGMGFQNLNGPLGLDGVNVGAEYGVVSGDGTNDLGVEGTFTNQFVSVHTGFEFKF